MPNVQCSKKFQTLSFNWGIGHWDFFGHCVIGHWSFPLIPPLDTPIGLRCPLPMPTTAPTYPQLTPPPRILLGPGPSDVHPRVLQALSTPLLGHLDPEFVRIMNETQSMLRYAFQTENKLTLPVSGTGSAGMETCVVNLIEPGDKMLVCVNGVFGQRMVDVAQRAGAVVTQLDAPWGKVFDPNQIRDAALRLKPKVIGIVHAETSTGAHQPMEAL